MYLMYPNQCINNLRMNLVDGVMGHYYKGNPDGLGSSFNLVGTSKATHISKFVEFYTVSII